MARIFVAALFIVLIGLPGISQAQITDRAAVADPASTPTADQEPELVRTYQQTITASDLAAHLYFFASDFFEGRETAQRGQHLAANYLAAQYRKFGVEPAGTTSPGDPRSPSAYYQPVPLYTSRIDRSTLTVKAADGSSRTSVFSQTGSDGGFFVGYGAAPEVSGSVVFGGFGIADETSGFDEVSALKNLGVDLSDKWLLIMAGEPMKDGKSLLSEDGSPSSWSTSPRAKYGSMMELGSMAGVLSVVDDGAAQSMDELTAEAAKQLVRPSRLTLDPPNARPDMRGRRGFPPVLMISTEMADALLKGTGKTIASLRAEIAETMTPEVFVVDGAEATSSMDMSGQELSSENVLALIEGNDPLLKDQVVVVSSHYDHVGFNPSLEGDQIFNGADDDGSGTVAVLEIAEAFAKARDAGHGPRRSILFLNVTGEEKGLLGSQYYTDRQPVFPLEKTVTNLNIDMIGRIDPTHPGEDSDYVYIIGSNLISQELHDINKRMNTLLGTNLDLNERFNSKNDPNRFYQRSDHWNFGKHNIPFIFFFTGTHEDYHGVDDEPEKIEYERMARITQAIFATAWQVANQDNAPAVSGQGFN